MRPRTVAQIALRPSSPLLCRMLTIARSHPHPLRACRRKLFALQSMAELMGAPIAAKRVGLCKRWIQPVGPLRPSPHAGGLDGMHTSLLLVPRSPLCPTPPAQ